MQAWADFKGKLSDGGGNSPASWKTRLRCALNKSTEFQEVAERGQLDISEPYKVYRLVPPAEQGERLQRHLLPAAFTHTLAMLCAGQISGPLNSINQMGKKRRWGNFLYFHI